MHPGPLKIKEKSYSTNVPPPDMPTNTVKVYQARQSLHCRFNIHLCWSSATLCRELLSCCSCNIYACWPSVFTATNTAAVLICLLVECCCKMDICWTTATQACLPIACHSIIHVCWCCASLSAIPSGEVLSLSAVPAGVVPHYRPWFLVW